MSGGTGSGKTTLLNALIALIPDDERIIAIEDTLELRIDAPNCVRFEARGLQHGAVTIRDLVKHALRHRPITSSSAKCAAARPPTSCKPSTPATAARSPPSTPITPRAPSRAWRAARCRADGDLPWDVTCRGVVDGIAMVIHMTRADGRRFVEEAAFVNGYDAGRKHMECATHRQAEGLTSGRLPRLARARGSSLWREPRARRGRWSPPR